MADKKKKGKVSGAIKAVGADIKDIGTTFAKGRLENQSFLFDYGLWSTYQKAVGKRNCIFGFGGSFLSYIWCSSGQDILRT